MTNIRDALNGFFQERAKESESKNLSKKFEFIITGNNTLKKIIAHISSNIIVKYSIIASKNSVENLFYENQIEQIVAETLYYDMVLEEFTYLPVIIDVVGENELRNICLNKERYLEKIQIVIAKQEEYRSCLLSRELEKQLSIV